LLYEEFNDFWDVARKRHIIFYVGYFSQHVVAAISETIKARLDTAGAAGPRGAASFPRSSKCRRTSCTTRRTRSRRTSTENQMRRGSFCIGMKGDSFFLLRQSGRQRQCGTHPQRLEPLHSMTMEEIKSAYKSPARRNPGRQQGRGPGLPDHGARRQRAAGIRIRAGCHNPNATVFCIKAII
jgi:hypothetical protein